MTAFVCRFLALACLLPLAPASRNVPIDQPRTPPYNVETATLEVLEGRGDRRPTRELLQSTEYIEVGSDMCLNYDRIDAAGAQAGSASLITQLQCEGACTNNAMSSPEETCFGFSYGVPPDPPPLPPGAPPVRSPPPLLVPPSPPPSPPPAANSPRTPSTHAGVGVSLPPLPPGYADFLRGYPQVTMSAPGTAVLAVKTTEAVIVQWMLTRADDAEVSVVNLQLPQQITFRLDYGTIQVFSSGVEATATLNNLQCTKCRVTLISKDSSLNFGHLWDVYFDNNAKRRRMLRAEDARLEVPNITETTLEEWSAARTSYGRRRNLLQTTATRCFLMLSAPTATTSSEYSNAKCYAKKVSPPPPPVPPPQPLYPPKAPGCDSTTESISGVNFKLYGIDSAYVTFDFSPAFDRSIHYYRATVEYDSARITGEAESRSTNLANLTFRDESNNIIGSSESTKSAASVDLNGPGQETTFLLVSRSIRGGAECPYTFKVTQMPEPPPPPYTTPPPSPPPKPPPAPRPPPSPPSSPPFPPESPSPPGPSPPPPPPPPSPPPMKRIPKPPPKTPAADEAAPQAQGSGGITESDLKAFGDDVEAAFADSPYYASIILAVVVFAVGSYVVMTECMIEDEDSPGNNGYDDHGIPLPKPPSINKFGKYFVRFATGSVKRSSVSPMGDRVHVSSSSQAANKRKAPATQKKEFVSPTRRPAETRKSSNSDQNDDPLLNKELPPLYPHENVGGGADVPSSFVPASSAKLGPKSPSLFAKPDTPSYAPEPKPKAEEESRPGVANGKETEVNKSEEQKQKEDVLYASFSYSIDEAEENGIPKASQNMPPGKKKHNDYASVHPLV
eukprot:CAMPEP_0114250954 /NCGR_PEP_ID=MMETSP0058-20121206/14988_1 /TAXON_ID=36894 /ORGANISM="Pyramimonas parkeae, CCMP726" /LENGTH=843 /DNA_ID=CAMNT_0001364675 /DNA_START=188 /DNA_END=2719 /DNA_ORIENTATION=-